jgi:hypothetical protein
LASPSPGVSALPRPTRQRARGSVVQHLHGRFVAFAEGIDLLRDAVFGQPKVAGLQPVNVVTFAIGDRETQDHHVDLDAKGRTLFLGVQRQSIEAMPTIASN